MRRWPLAFTPIPQQQKIAGSELNGVRTRNSVGEDVLVENFVQARDSDAQRGRGFRFSVKLVLGYSAQSRHRGASRVPLKPL